MRVSISVFVLLLLGNRAKGHGNYIRNRLAAENMVNEKTFHRHMLENQVDSHARCGTTVTDSDVQAIQLAQAFSKYKTAETSKGAMPTPRKTEKPQAFPRPPKKKIIPVCFHVIGRRIPRWQLNKDLVALNRAFSGASCCDPSQSWCVPGTCSPDTGIRFEMARLVLGRVRGTIKTPISLFSCVKRKWKELDMSEEDVEKEVKKTMHMGDGRILNIYFSKLNQILGYATFPTSIQSDTTAYLDGVMVNRDARVGGGIQRFSEGDSLAHEVG